MPVLAPMDVPEAAELTQLAFHLSQRWRNPVLFFGDYYLAHTSTSVAVGSRDFGALEGDDWSLDGSTSGTGHARLLSPLGTTKRKDGTLQVTYAGHPLYTFIKDASPGEATGNGLEFFGGKWSVLDEAGSTVEGSSGEETEAVEESSSGGGYRY